MVCCADFELEGLWAAGEDGGALGDAERHACALRGCTDSSGGSVARSAHAGRPAPGPPVCFDASDAGCAVRMQRLEPFIALMLIRQRMTLMDTTGGGQHRSALGAAVMALPSGLLAMVCAAMLKLESKLDVRPSFLGLKILRCAACPHCTPHATSSALGNKHALHDRR